MPATPRCVCGHLPTFHSREKDGVERCQFLTCICRGFVDDSAARDCTTCAHTFLSHKAGRCSSCTCENYQTVQALPIDQIRELAFDRDLIVVIVEVDPDAVDDAGAYLSVPGTLYAAAGLVLLQKGPGLYRVVGDNPQIMPGEEFASEQVIIEKLRQLRQKLND